MLKKGLTTSLIYVISVITEIKNMKSPATKSNVHPWSVGRFDGSNGVNTEITESALSKTVPLRGHIWTALKWLAALAPIVVCVAVADNTTSWLFMWLLAASIFVGAKWVTLAEILPLRTTPVSRLAAYLFLWPGLAPASFCFEKGKAPAPTEWLTAIAKTTFGVAIVWGGLRFLPARHPLILGWAGMVGIVFVLHFGIFHLLSNLWRELGFNARPLMRNPLRASSVAGFWGGRWNTAFNDLMAPNVFAPLARRLGPGIAAVTVFLLSGLLHEIVISLPARGGFGLPTLYFAIQALGLLAERSRWGRKLGLGRGLRGWLFTVFITAGAAPLLFHPLFIRNVILPMLKAIGAT
jgi:Membrane bound O-acyl transferase family